MASGQRRLQQHVVLTSLMVLAVLGAAAGAREVLGKRAGVGGRGEDEAPPAVEEVFGRSAVIEADESRRIYAISIPSLYQDERGQGSSVEGSYHPPVYRPQHGGGGHRAVDSRRPPPPYSGGGGLSPAPYTASQSSPHPHWKSGLRLIVSGPADDNPSKSYPVQGPSSYEYDLSPESYRSDYNYRSPYEDNSPRDAVPSYEREYTRDSHPSRNRDFVEPHDRDRSPLWEDYHDEPSYPSYQEGEEYQDDTVQHRPKEPSVYEEKEDRRRFPNSPYHKLPEPYSVVDEPPKVEQSEDPEPIPPVSHEGETSLIFNRGNVNSEKDPAVVDAQGLNNPQEYYDSLYEEFMETAYDDYYDHLPSDAVGTEPQIGSDLSPPPLSSSPKSTVGTQSDRESPNQERPLRKSETRRDPPGDMYTTSRSTVQPKSRLVGTHDEDAGSGKDLPLRDSFLEEDLRHQDKEKEDTEEETVLQQASSSVLDPSSQLTAVDELPESQDTSPEPPAESLPSSTPPVPEGPPSPSSEPPSPSPTDTEVTTTQRSRIPKPTHAYKHRPSASLISLSEVLQGIGVSLPQFLVQLKMHGSDLKGFTNKLERRALTKLAFKRAQGNVGELLKILDEDIEEVESSLLVKSTTWSPNTTVRPSFKSLNGYAKKTTSVAETTETTTTSTTTTRRTTTTTEATTTTTSAPTTKQPLSPKMFGFKPSATVNRDGVETAVANISIANATLGKEGNATNKSLSGNTGSIESSAEIAVEKTSPEEKQSVYNPYKPDNGGWRERMMHNRGVSSRLGTSTRRPTVRPNYKYNAGKQDLADLIERQDSSSEGGTREVIEIDVVELETSGSSQSSGIGLLDEESVIVGLTVGTPLGGSYNHPRYDRDPHSLNIATRSAIMAAGILGGIAMAVFVTILLFVMYRNHVGKRRLRVPFPHSVSSGDSTSSTPPLYSTRSRSGISTRSSTHTDFWGTLKRKFDPYSISSTSASYY